MITFTQFLNAFIESGLIKLETIGSNKEILINKFRNQFKRLKYTIDSLFKIYCDDEQGLVMKDWFINDCFKAGF